MLLTLSSSLPWDATYSDEAGQVLFTAETVEDSMKVSRISITDQQNEQVGEVRFHVFKNSTIKCRGQDQAVNQFFTKTGFGFYGRNRLFRGPDGKEYIWKMSEVCKLFLNDPPETPVAIFHHKHQWGVFRKKGPASLEIFPPGKDMVDLILITFIYMEKLRN